MTNFLALVRREMGVYFASPMAYIILTALLFISGFFFVQSVSHASANSIPLSFETTLLGMLMVVALTSALVTMRLIAEEKSTGTLEIILTAPVTEFQFVLAKFVSAMFLLVYLLLPTLGFALLIAPYGAMDWGAILCGYFGILVVGGVAYSAGLFVSSLCTSQITAGMITFAVSMFLLIMGILTAYVPEDSPFLPFLKIMDLSAAFVDYLRGIVDLGRLTFAVSFMAFFLFVTTRVVESRRWR